MPTWLGDIVMATPALVRLRDALPEARLTAITPPGMDVVLRGLPAIDEVVAVDGKGLAGPWRTAAAIRAASRTAVLLLPNSFRSALAGRLAGSRVRVGSDRDGRGILLTHRVAAATSAGTMPTPTVVQYDRVVARAIGRDPVDPDAPGPARLALRPRLVAGPEDREEACRHLGDARDAPLLVLVPGGNRAAKRWPGERFAATARILRRDLGLTPVITGSPGERALCRELAAAIGPPVVDLAAAGASLAAVKGVIAAARLLVTNDTGPRHLAAGLGTPCIALFGPTDARWTTLPGVAETILLAEPFLPESLVADRHADLCRIERIPVSDVVHAAGMRLAAVPGATDPSDQGGDA